MKGWLVVQVSPVRFRAVRDDGQQGVVVPAYRGETAGARARRLAREWSAEALGRRREARAGRSSRSRAPAGEAPGVGAPRARQGMPGVGSRGDGPKEGPAGAVPGIPRRIEVSGQGDLFSGPEGLAGGSDDESAGEE